MMVADGYDTLLGAELVDGRTGIDVSTTTLEGGDEQGEGELLWQLIEKQHCLSNLQAIIINTVVCILCDAQFFSKQFDTFPKIGNGFYSLVQCV